MFRKQWLGLGILLAGLASGAHAQFAHTRGEEILGTDGRPLMLRGTNFGNWMVTEGYMWQFGGHVQSEHEIESFVTELIGPTREEAFFKQWRATYVTADDVHLLHEAGFNSIRIPMHYRFFQTDDAEGFQLLDKVVGWCRAEKMYLILDMHAAPGGQTGTNIDDSFGYPWLFYDAHAQQQLVDTWARIAKHYRNEPVVLGYDLLNEPIPPYPQLETQKLNAMLEPLYKRVSAAIRKVDTHHVLILGGAQWDNNFEVFGPPYDSNVIYQWHRYKVEHPDDSTVKPYVEFRAKYHVPVWLGESGENTDAWVAQMRAVVEKNGMGWAFWPYKKIGSTAGVENVKPPQDWAAIVAYSKVEDGVGLTSSRLKSRPSQEVIDRAFAELLENIKLAKCTTNTGYVKALLPDAKLAPAN